MTPDAAAAACQCVLAGRGGKASKGGKGRSGGKAGGHGHGSSSLLGEEDVDLKDVDITTPLRPDELMPRMEHRATAPTTARPSPQKAGADQQVGGSPLTYTHTDTHTASRVHHQPRQRPSLPPSLPALLLTLHARVLLSGLLVVRPGVPVGQGGQAAASQQEGGQVLQVVVVIGPASCCSCPERGSSDRPGRLHGRASARLQHRGGGLFEEPGC